MLLLKRNKIANEYNAFLEPANFSPEGTFDLDKCNAVVEYYTVQPQSLIPSSFTHLYVPQKCKSVQPKVY